MDTSRPTVGSEKGYRFDLVRSLVLSDGSALPLRMTELYVPGGEGTSLVAVIARDTPDGRALGDDIVGRVRPA
jgi:hypothetical protein